MDGVWERAPGADAASGRRQRASPHRIGRAGWEHSPLR